MKYVAAVFIALALTGNAQAAGLDPDYAKGVTLYDNERFQEAIPLLKSAVQSSKDNHDALYRLAVSFEKTGQYEDALKVWQRLEPWRKLYPSMDFSIAQLNYTLRNFKDAYRGFQRTEKAGYRVEASRYHMAYMQYMQKNFPAATDLFRLIEKEGKDKDIIQASVFYLGLMTFTEEEPDFEDNKFKKTLAQLTSAMNMNPASDTGQRAAAKIAEINELLGHKPPPQTLVVSFAAGTEYDSNVLNENSNPNIFAPSNASALKISGIADVTWNIYKTGDFLLGTGLNTSMTYYYPVANATRDDVYASDSLTFAIPVRMSNDLLWGRTPMTLSYPVKATFSMREASATQHEFSWAANSYAVSVSPALQWKAFEPDITSVGLDYTLTKGLAADAVTTNAVTASYIQTWQITTALGSTWNFNGSYSLASDDSTKMSGTGGFTFNWPLWDFIWSAASSYTYGYFPDRSPTRTDHTISITLTLTKLIGDWLAIAINLGIEDNISNDVTGAYIKYKTGAKATTTF